MAWCDLQLGPSGSPRPDVFTLFKSFVRPTPMAYECKVSISDFRADVTSGKWQSYLPFASGVYFACEAGLFSKADVPDGCGLIVLTNGNWRAAKKPTLRAVALPQDAWLKLLIDGVEREGPRYRVKTWSESTHLHRLSQQFGDVVGRTIRDRLAVDQEVEGRKYQAKRILSDAQRRAEEIRADATEHVEPLRKELCEVLGLPADADRWQIARGVNEIRDAIAEHPAHTRLKRLTASLQRALERDGFKAVPMPTSEVDA